MQKFVQFLFFAAALVWVGFSPGSILAQAQTEDVVDETASFIVREKLEGVNGENDFVVGPGKIELEIAPGESKTFELTIANRLGVKKDFELTLEDVAGSEAGDQAVVLLGTDTGPYSLRDYIRIPENTITIEHGERVRIPVTISLPANASPQGKYGSIVVAVASEATDVAVEQSRSTIVSRIGTLVFVTTPGEARYDGVFDKFSTIGDRSWYTGNTINFGILYTNRGTVHLNPYGTINIYNIFNQVVGSVDISPWYVLPDASRLREVSWTKQPLFGRYVAVLSLYNGYDKAPVTDTYTFYVINWWVLGGGVLLACVILISSRFFMKRLRNNP